MPEPTRQSRSGELAHRAARAAAIRRASSQLCSSTAAATASITSRRRFRRTPLFDEGPLRDGRREALIPELDRSRCAPLRARPRTPRALSAAVTLAAVQAARQSDDHAVHLAIFHLARETCPDASARRWERSQAARQWCRSRRRPPVRSGPSRRRCRGRACGRYRPRLASRRLGRDSDEVLVDIDLRRAKRQVEELERPLGDTHALDLRDVALDDLLRIAGIPPGELRFERVQVRPAAG